MLFGKDMMKVMGAILLTGAVLNLAGQGLFGASVADMAKYVTKGYGQ